MKWSALLIVWFLTPVSSFAGLYLSTEKIAELPSSFRGYLVDQRALRMLAVPPRADVPSTLFRDGYVHRLAELEKLGKLRELTADELADHGALLVRLGRVEKAVEVLFAAKQKHPAHFRIVSNLATASQVRGDLDRAASLLEEALRLAPEPLREMERFHLRLVRLRLREEENKSPSDAPDNLFGEKLPKNALAVVQQLGLWLPGDVRLLWQLGELASGSGDTRTAAAILDGCVTELGLRSDAARVRRRQLREAVDALDALPEDQRHTTSSIPPKSSRPLLNRLDAALLPVVDAKRVNPLPWLVLGETTIERGFKPQFLPYLTQLEGKSVSLTGFMQPLGEGPDVSAFLLLEYQVGCWYCESPERITIVQVEMGEGQTIALRRGLVKVEGKLSMNRTDPEKFLYTLTDSTVRDPD